MSRVLVLQIVVALTLVSACTSKRNLCGDLVEDRATGSCRCPEGSTPVGDGWSCVLADGGVIRNPNGPYVLDGGLDGGVADDAETNAPDAPEVLDAGLDGGPDAHLFPERDFTCAPETDPPCETTTPTRTEEERTVSLASTLEDESFAFVVDSLSVTTPPGTDGGRIGAKNGFNLDGEDAGFGATGTCQDFFPDYLSRDGSRQGIDNGFEDLVPVLEGVAERTACPGGTTSGCLDGTISGFIAEQSWYVIVEVTDVDDRFYDDDVGIALYLGATESGGGLTGLDQRMTTSATLAAEVRGDIFDNVVRARWTDVDLQFPSHATGLPLPGALRDVELRFELDRRFLSGEMGGHVGVDEARRADARGQPGARPDRDRHLRRPVAFGSGPARV
ncbi:MAG: hypothetical protein H6721_30195 [Sandaracinus sp.]|nr:hypothetical protein [Sandaracinus sp.]